MTRQTIVLDVETTGLEDHHAVLEIAAVNLYTGEGMHFVPFVSMKEFARASPDALRINRYFERGLRDSMLDLHDTVCKFEELQAMLAGNTLAGSNPAFDAAHLKNINVNIGGYEFAFGAPWHHRLWDLSAYAKGKLGLDELPGLHKVCELLGITNEGEHTALGDARVTAACFRRLEAIPPHADISELVELAEGLSGLNTRGAEFVDRVAALTTLILAQANKPII